MFPDAPVSTFAFRFAGMCGLSSSVMLIIAKISSRVSPLSLLTLSIDNASNVSSRAGDFVTMWVRSSFGYPCRYRVGDLRRCD